MKLDRFAGMGTRPDADSVGSRFSRNVVFGPSLTWIEGRPGTWQLTETTHPGADTTASGKDIVYEIEDLRLNNRILLCAAPDTQEANTGTRGQTASTRIVHEVTHQPWSGQYTGVSNQQPSVLEALALATDNGQDLLEFDIADQTNTLEEEGDAYTGGNYRVLSTDRNGRQWVADFEDIRIFENAAIGTAEGTYNEGTYPLLFSQAQASAHGGNMYLLATKSASGNDAILYFAQDGAVTSLGTLTLTGSADRPRGLTYATDGDLLCLCRFDGTNWGVCKFSRTNASVTYVADLGIAYSVAPEAHWIALGPSGETYAVLPKSNGDVALVKFTAGASSVTGISEVTTLTPSGSLKAASAVVGTGGSFMLIVQASGSGSTRDVFLWNGSTLSSGLLPATINIPDGVNEAISGWYNGDMFYIPGDGQSGNVSIAVFTSSGTVSNSPQSAPYSSSTRVNYEAWGNFDPTGWYLNTYIDPQVS